MTKVDTRHRYALSMIAMELVAPLIRAPDAVWRLTEHALVMPGAVATRLLGRWDCEFGCWEWAGSRLTIPSVTAQILDRRGVWPDPPGQRDETWYTCRAALAAWFSLIPTPMRRLVAPHAGRQWELLLAIRNDPSVARDLDDA
jgi:hypothetical protein